MSPGQEIKKQYKALSLIHHPAGCPDVSRIVTIKHCLDQCCAVSPGGSSSIHTSFVSRHDEVVSHIDDLVGWDAGGIVAPCSAESVNVWGHVWMNLRQRTRTKMMWRLPLSAFKGPKMSCAGELVLEVGDSC